MTSPLPQTPLPSDASHARAESASDLVARIRAGEEDAFAALFLEHYTALCQFVDSFVRAPDIAEEIVQAVFLRIWEHRRSWDPRAGPRAYLFASCRNQAVDALRHEQIVAQSVGRDAYLGIGRLSAPRLADTELEAEELADKLRSVVAELPERRRLVVILRWQHQLSNPEIARILGISVKGVEMQFSRALADLRRHLGSRLLDFD